MAVRSPQGHTELDAIRDAIAALDRRLTALERTAAAESAGQDDAGPPVRTGESRPRLTGAAFALTGRAFLAFGGAFVLRALTESQTIGPKAGVWLGIGYAIAWLAAAVWSAGASRLLNSWLTLAIGLPLVLEAAGRFRLLSVGAGVTALGLVAGLPLLFGWLRRLPSVAAGAAVGGAVVSLAAGLSTGHFLPFAALNILFGVGALWSAWHRDWPGLAWLSAGAVNLTMLVTAIRACVRPPLDPPLGAEAVLAGFGVLYLGSFVLRTLIHERTVHAFEVAQTLAVMVLGFGGAIAVARVNGLGLITIGLPAVIAGIGLYAQSFLRVAARRGYGGDFHYYGFTAFGLLLAGVTVVLPAALLPAVTAAGALALAGLASHLRQTPLTLQAAIALAIAAAESGLLTVAFSSWTGRLETWPAFGWPAGLVLAVAAISYAAPAVTRLDRDGFSVTARVLIGALLACGAACLALLAAGPVMAGRPPAPGVLATVRTVILTASAVLLARLGRGSRWRELGWIAYAALAFTGLKILIEDVPRSQAATLFIALAAYGLALILTPRMMRSQASTSAASF